MLRKFITAESTRQVARPVTRVVSAVLVGAALIALSGCTKCGWIWEDWQGKPGACLSDPPAR